MSLKELQSNKDESPRQSISHSDTSSATSSKPKTLQDEMEDLENRLKNSLILREPTPEQTTFYDKQSANKIIENVLKIRSFDQVIQEKFKLNLTRGDIETLVGTKWLNDQIINFYMNLICERSSEMCRPRVYATNTFFYSKLAANGYESVKRWTKKVDIFEYDLIIVPINLIVHWTVAVIDFRNKSIKYYDSLGGSNHQCVSTLLKYLRCETLDKKSQEFESSGWNVQSKVNGLPKQTNGYDCGVFICAYAEVLSRDASFTISQERMGSFRRKMIYEIITGRLINTIK